MARRQQDPVPVAVGGWCVLVEEITGQAEGQRWSLSHIRPFATRDEALMDAAMMTRQYEPQHPARPRGRWIYRVGQDSWTVVVQGAMSRFHFRVSVAQSEAV